MEIFDICAILVKKMFWIIAEASILFVYPLLLMLDEFLYLMQWFFNAVINQQLASPLDVPAYLPNA